MLLVITKLEDLLLALNRWIIYIFIVTILNLAFSYPFSSIGDFLHGPVMWLIFVPLHFLVSYAFGLVARFVAQYGELDTHRGVFISCVFICLVYAWISVFNLTMLLDTDGIFEHFGLPFILVIPALVIGAYLFKYHVSEVWFWRGQERSIKRLIIIQMLAYAVILAFFLQGEWTGWFSPWFKYRWL